MECSWRYEHYRWCLLRAKEMGYSIVQYDEAAAGDSEKPLIVLRHDIERSIPRALNMAKMENEIAVRSTYFVRVHAPQYNVFEYNSYRALKEILSLGHGIGLHFEAVDFAYLTGEKVRDIILREKRVLEEALGISVDITAAHGEHTTAGPRHNRSLFDTVGREEVGIRYDAYDQAFFGEMKYISDSFGFWREGCMCRHLGQHPRMQILVHPCWWFQEHPYE